MTVFKHKKPGSFYYRIGLLLLSIVLFSFTTTDSRSQYRIPIAAYSVTAGDIDLDGDNDIVVGHNYCFQTEWSGVSIMLNDGNGTFLLSDSIYLYSWQTHIHAVNTNSSPYPEIIARHFENDTNYMVLLEYVQGNYLPNLHYMSYGISGHNIGDINGDNYVDIVVYSHDGQFWAYMLNDGSGNFASPWYTYVQDYYPLDIACADLNDDGWEDVVVVGQQKTEVYFSYPGTFYLLELESDLAHKVSIADFDQDGDNDILTIGTFAGTFLVMHENRGSNTFSVHDVFAFQPQASRFYISDFNNDSYPDLLFQLDDNTGYVIYYNQGNFQLGDSLFIAVEPHEYEGLRNCFCCDLDGNNYNDIIITRLAQVALPDNLMLLFNDGNGNFVENPVSVYDTQMPEPKKPIVCYPNPFSNQLTIEIELDNSNTDSRIEIFDIKGNLVKTFEAPGLVSKNYSVKWDGKDLSGNMIKPGTYIVCAKMNGHKYAQRIIKIPY